MAAKNKSVFEFSPALESAGHIQLKDQYELFINGKWTKPKSGKYFKTTIL